MTKNRRTHDKALKEEADRLGFEERRKTAEVVGNLGIGKGIVIRRVRESRENPIYSFPGRILTTKDGFRVAFSRPLVKDNPRHLNARTRLSNGFSSGGARVMATEPFSREKARIPRSEPRGSMPNLGDLGRGSPQARAGLSASPSGEQEKAP